VTAPADPRPPPPIARRFRVRPAAVVVTAAWGLYVAITLGPLAVSLGRAVAHLGAGEAEALALLLPSARRTGLLLDSLVASLAVTGFAVVVGTLAAAAFLRRGARHGLSPRATTLLLAALVLWAITPPDLHALAGMQAGNLLAAALRTIGIAAAPPELPAGLAAFAAQGFALLPIALAAALVGFAGIGGGEHDAARLLAAPGRVFLRVVLPLAAPAITAGAAAVFVLALLDHATPSLFGRAGHAMEIVAEYGASRSAWRAALVALPLIALAAGAIAAALTVVARAGRALAGTAARRPLAAAPLGPSAVAEGIAAAVVIAYAALFVALAAGGLGLGAALPRLVFEVRRDLATTLLDAGLAAALALGPAAAIGWHLAAPGGSAAGRRIAWAVVLLPLAVPPALTGIGITELLADHAPMALRTSPLVPVWPYLARFLPFAVLVVHAAVRRIDPTLVEAARLHRPSGPARWRRIEGPLTAPGLVAAFALVFCGAVGELEATLMAAAPGAGVLSMRVFNYLHYGASDTVAALGLLLGVTVWGVAAATLGALGRPAGRDA
jgi:iron(III) transport system permease protein